MDQNSYVKSIAALLAWREEASNGISGMLGVLFVIRNRAKAGWHQGDWDKIMLDRNQFSSMTVPGDGQLVHYPDPRDPNFIKLLQLIDGIYDGSTPDTLTNNALYYADLLSPGFQVGGWFDRTIIKNPAQFPMVAKIGTTTYYAVKGL